MTLPAHLRIRAAAIAEQFRHFKAAHPLLDMIGVRGSTPDAIAILTRDELLAVLNAVAQGAVPESDTPRPDAWPRDETFGDDLADVLEAPTRAYAGVQRQTLEPGASIPLRKPEKLAELNAEGSFLAALDVYAEAVTAFCTCARPAIAEAVALARQGVIEAHLSGARVRAVGLAEAMQAWNVEPTPILSPGEGIPLRRSETLAEKLYTCFFTMTIDDASEPGTPARARFMERLRILDEVMGALKGRSA